MKDKANIPDKLNTLDKDNKFGVPEGYFDSFASRVQDSIHEQPSPSISNSIYTILKPYIALTTIFATAALLIFLAVKIFIPTQVPDQLADNIEWYFEEFSEDDIMELEPQTEIVIDEQLYEQEIVNYLLDEGIDYDQIIDAL